jgi:hypothetical protein
LEKKDTVLKEKTKVVKEKGLLGIE